MADLRAEGVRAVHGGDEVLRGVDLAVPEGTVVAVLGPSGCGKTTLLRTLAGHHRLSGGRIALGERELAGTGGQIAPEHRSIGLVPQEGALFPHLTVHANIAFGLRGRRDADARVRRMLELVGLDGFERRRPHQLSGGQQQRVALARALAPAPQALLLDEPFSALDARVRESVRADVRQVLRREGCTAVLVTHDRTEAFTTADQVAVMADGVVVQQGAPQEVYRRPADVRTAEFTGPCIVFDLAMSASRPGDAMTPLGPVAVGGDGDLVLVRPEQIRPHADGVDAVVTGVVFGGASSELQIELVGGRRYPMAVTGAGPAVGDRLRVGLDGPAWRLRS